MIADEKTVKLANDIRDLLGKHVQGLEENYPEALTSCLVALCVEVGRLRWLSVATGEVKEDDFDHTFWECSMKHYNENKLRYREAGQC